VPLDKILFDFFLLSGFHGSEIFGAPMFLRVIVDLRHGLVERLLRHFIVLFLLFGHLRGSNLERLLLFSLGIEVANQDLVNVH
jgi:hypothetical protein